MLHRFFQLLDTNDVAFAVVAGIMIATAAAATIYDFLRKRKKKGGIKDEIAKNFGD